MAAESLVSGDRQDLVWLVTGASAGLGLALTGQLLAAGARVAALARSAGPLAGLAAQYPQTMLCVAADITSAPSVDAAVAAALGCFGRIDVLVNNAGSGLFGTVEELTDTEVMAQLDVSVLGPWRLIRAVLPGMRTRRSGLIINVSSVAGFVGQPGNAAYNAGKSALDGMSEALASELREFGIGVMLVIPGPFRTAFLQGCAGPAQRVDAYPDYTAATRSRAGKQASDPAKMAAELIKAAGPGKPPFRLVLGSDAWNAIRSKLAVLSAELDACQGQAMSVAVTGSEAGRETGRESGGKSGGAAAKAAPAGA